MTNEEQDALQQQALQVSNAVIEHVSALHDIRYGYELTMPVPRDDWGDPILIHSPISLANLPDGTRIYLIDDEYQVSPDGMIWPPRAVDDITPPSSTMTFDAFWDEMVTCYAYHIDNPDMLPHITHMPDTNM
jgi:hypothetical protein